MAAVGDSFVEGACVDSSETLVADIRRVVPQTLGVGLDGAGPLSELGLVKEYLPRVRPRIVLWFYYEGNDLSDLTSELQVPELQGYLKPDWVQHLPEHVEALDASILKMYEQRRARPRASGETSLGLTAGLWQWARLSRLRGALALGEVSKRMKVCCDLRAFAGVLQEARRTVESWGGRLYIVYLPAPGRSLRPLSGMLTDQLRYRRRVLRLIHDMGLTVVDVYPAFRQHDPSVLFYDVRSHYTAVGYKVAAEEVVRHLDRPE